MSEIFDRKNLSLFGLTRQVPFGENFCREPEPLPCAHHSIHSPKFKECGWFGRWRGELGHSAFMKLRYQKTLVCEHGKETWRLVVSLDDETFWHSSTTEENASPLDASLVSRYQELRALEANGQLSDDQKAELGEIECCLDDQELAVSEQRESEPGLDREIERLKQLIELSRQAVSLV
jgi:hypothetical protein